MKEWVKRYGIHIVICALIVGITFTVNTRINTERSHIYTVSDPIYTVLKEVTSVKKENGSVVFTGWGFDTNYYDEESTCELILQDTETGEAFWPKMAKNPEPVQIADRYTDGGDYSDAGFEGSLKENKLEENSAYEILLRYTSNYTDEAGMEQQYVRTVTTDEFFYQGEMTEYNPKTFVALEIAGTELEKVIKNGKFHYFSEDGMYIYEYNNAIYYIADSRFKFAENGLTELPLHIFPVNKAMLDEKYADAGFENRDIMFENYEISGDFGEYRVAVRELPDNYAIAYIVTGLYDSKENKWIWRKVISMVNSNE